MGRPSKFDPIFKAKVTVEALQEKEPLAVLAKMYHEVPLSSPVGKKSCSRTHPKRSSPMQ